MNMKIDSIELPDSERDALRALHAATVAHPLATWFEHDNAAVHQLGAVENVRIAAGRTTLRRLNHRRLLKFDRTKAPRWVFRLSPIAIEFTV
jgi:hypothetical protein